VETAQLFLQRYDVLCDFWLAGIWEQAPADLMRRRPHPRVNSLVWSLWHLTRVEDAGLNRFVTDGVQVFEEGRWLEQGQVPVQLRPDASVSTRWRDWRHRQPARRAI
jgi:hypothetical protein